MNYQKSPKQKSEREKDPKLGIRHDSSLSRKIDNLLQKGETVSFKEIWNNRYITEWEYEKKNYDIIQFSFVVLDEKNNILFIERKKHIITSGYSVCRSYSPFTSLSHPASLEDIKGYAKKVIELDKFKCGIKLLGIARNIKKEITYRFYIFCIKLQGITPEIKLISTNDKPQWLPFNKKNQNKVEDNSLDWCVLEALLDKTRNKKVKSYIKNECFLIKDDKNQTLHKTLLASEEIRKDDKEMMDKILLFLSDKLPIKRQEGRMLIGNLISTGVPLSEEINKKLVEIVLNTSADDKERAMSLNLIVRAKFWTSYKALLNLWSDCNQKCGKQLSGQLTSFFSNHIENKEGFIYFIAWFGDISHSEEFRNKTEPNCLFDMLNVFRLTFEWGAGSLPESAVLETMYLTAQRFTDHPDISVKTIAKEIVDKIAGK